MNLRLMLKRNRKCVWTAQLSQRESTLGRARGCTVRIPSSEVSRQHCRLRVEKDVVTVEDLESVNGTFINGTRVRSIEKLRSGDRLSLGPITFVVEYDLATRAKQAVVEIDDDLAVEAESAIEAVEETAAHPGDSPIPMLEPVEEEPEPVYPVRQVEAIEDAQDELSILDDPSSEIHLPESGDDFRDFLIELDDSGERPDLR